VSLYRAREFEQAAHLFEEIYNSVQPIAEPSKEQIDQTNNQKKTLHYWVLSLKQCLPHSTGLLSVLKKSIALYEG